MGHRLVRKYYGAKSGIFFDTQKVYEGQLREFSNTEKLEVAEHIPLQEAVVYNQESVRGKWLDDAKGTPEDPDAVRSRLVCDTGTQVCPRGCDAGDATNQCVQNHCESSVNENDCEGPARFV